MLRSLLKEAEEKLLEDERGWLSELRALLAELGASDDFLEPLDESVSLLDELFLLVVVGEFNSGKSSLINALLGQDLLPEGVTPTTASVHLLHHAEASTKETGADGVVRVGEPLPILEQLRLVDTPGTNAVIREHEVLTQRFVPRADLVLFVTSADRPFSESERSFLERIRDWGKKVVLVVNKIDLLTRDSDRQEVETFVRGGAGELLGVDPPLFLVSAREAVRRTKGAEAAQDGIHELESYVRNTLDDKERLRLKLGNPLGVGERLLATTKAEVDDQIALLDDDRAAVDDLTAQLEVYRREMEEAFRLRLAEIENVLHAMEKRGRDFLDRNLRLRRIMDLLDRARIRREFEAEVVGEGPQTVERKVGELAEWMASSDLKQWQAVSRYLEERVRQRPERIVGGGKSEFHDTRHQVIDTVRGSAERVVATYDRSAEAEQIAEAARKAVAGSAALEVGAIGLGALVASLATTSMADVTGLLAAGLLATVGLFVIPTQKRQAIRDLAEKIADLQRRLEASLVAGFEGELARSMDRLGDVAAPYRRFVRAESERLGERRESLRNAEDRAEGLRARIAAM